MKKRILCGMVCILLLLTGCNSGGKSGVIQDGSMEETALVTTKMSLTGFIEKYNEFIKDKFLDDYKVNNASDDLYIGCAKTLLNKDLINPSTAVFNETRVVEKDAYGRGIVLIDVSAQNGYGGYNRDKYYFCIENPDKQGVFSYSPLFNRIDDFNNYETLKLMNNFGSHPNQEDVDGLLMPNDTAFEVQSLVLGKTNIVDMYTYNNGTALFRLYVDKTAQQLVASQITVYAANSPDTDTRNQVVSTFEASIQSLTALNQKSANEQVAKLISPALIEPSATPVQFNKNILFECKREARGITLSMTAMTKKIYESQKYWTPDSHGAYQVQMADSYMAARDFDGAISLLNEIGTGGDKLYAAYYGKAENLLSSGNLAEAATYFEKAGAYSDSKVRLLEVHYKFGIAAMGQKNFSSAIQAFNLSTNYEDSAEKLRQCNFLQGTALLEQKEYAKAIPHLQEAGSYPDATAKYQEANYLHGEQLIALGNVIEAEAFFKAAGEYSGADKKIAQYYYDQGNIKAASKNYLEAVELFKRAGNYEDAAAKYVEMNYLYGSELIQKDEADNAKPYFMVAKGYKDADTKFFAFFYEKGVNFISTKNYLEAIKCFDQADDYKDSKEKYLEMNYLYGTELLTKDLPEDAASYFKTASGYKDADTRISDYYYRRGNDLLSKKLFLEAEELFRLAGSYSNAAEKIKECFYEHGKAQLEDGFVSEGLEYLQRSGDFKDARDIIADHSYKIATDFFNDYIDGVAGIEADLWGISENYDSSKLAFEACDGYKDSERYLTILENLERIRNASYQTNYTYFSMSNFKTKIEPDEVQITNDYYYSNQTPLTLTFNDDMSTFNANASKVFASNLYDGSELEGMIYLISIFTNPKDNEDIREFFGNGDNWTPTENGAKVKTMYNGYQINLEYEVEDYMYITCILSGTKNK